MIIRKYKPADCKILTELFYNTVHSVNAKDYTKEQLNAWTADINLEQWNKIFLKDFTVVAIESGIAAGFGNIDTNGYLDKLYTHKDYLNKGIASAICDVLETSIDSKIIYTHSSITAKHFFKKRGYNVVKEQQVERKGILLTNYVMKKQYSQIT